MERIPELTQLGELLQTIDRLEEVTVLMIQTTVHRAVLVADQLVKLEHQELLLHLQALDHLLRLQVVKVDLAEVDVRCNCNQDYIFL